MATIDKINELRGGSSSIRFNMYAETFRLTMESNPIYGIAVKPRDYFFIPLGSHSTYLGAFLKTGVIGMLCLIYFNLKFWKSYFSIVLKPKSQAMSNTTAALCALSIFFSLEDLDAAQALSFLYFVLVGTHIGNIKSCNGNS
ncbi:hypothetical protein [Marinobacterium aestuariivivens]|uniref:O-antigen ligase domain-containing protein n=1 Tax=Marinobacterium aestuariivivens TaxID=1698799 RepID=A0ABW1ZZD8_9GAMM